MKGLVILLVILTLLLAGCGALYDRSMKELDVEETPEVVSGGENIVVDIDEGISEFIEIIGPMDSTWIGPGKVTFGNFVPGNEATYPITIHNGSSDSKSFLMWVMTPSLASEEYSNFIREVSTWVTFGDNGFIMAPKETRRVFVTLKMPDSTFVPHRNWEFWIAVKEGQSSFIQEAVASRWVFEMGDY